MALVDEVRKLLGEASAAFWVDAQIRDAINEAQVCVYADHPRIFETSTTLTIHGDYDFVSIPSGIMIPRYITSSDGKEYFNFISHADLEEYSGNWMDTSTGVPVAFVVWSSEYLRVWPRPSTTRNYTLVGTPWPTECTALADPNLPWLVEDAVVSYATAMLFAQTRPDLTELHMQEYMDAMRDYLVQWRRAHPNTVTRLHPAARSGSPAALFAARQRGNVSVIRGVLGRSRYGSY